MAVFMDKTKQKTILDMTPQELLKSFVQQVGAIIDARNETLKTVLMAEIKATKDELKADIKGVEQKLDTIVQDHEERIERLEDHTGIHKN
jgi:hypothetical protein